MQELLTPGLQIQLKDEYEQLKNEAHRRGKEIIFENVRATSQLFTIVITTPLKQSTSIRLSFARTKQHSIMTQYE